MWKLGENFVPLTFLKLGYWWFHIIFAASSKTPAVISDAHLEREHIIVVMKVKISKAVSFSLSFTTTDVSFFLLFFFSFYYFSIFHFNRIMSWLASGVQTMLDLLNGMLMFSGLRFPGEVRALKHIWDSIHDAKQRTHRKVDNTFYDERSWMFLPSSPPVKERANATLINIDQLFREMSLEMEKWTRPSRETKRVRESRFECKFKVIICKRKDWNGCNSPQFLTHAFSRHSLSCWVSDSPKWQQLTLALNICYRANTVSFISSFFFFLHWHEYTRHAWHSRNFTPGVLVTCDRCVSFHCHL